MKPGSRNTYSKLLWPRLAEFVYVLFMHFLGGFYSFKYPIRVGELSGDGSGAGFPGENKAMFSQ
jgi:hypothetical protein